MALIRTRVRHGVSPMNTLIRSRDVKEPIISLDVRTKWSIRAGVVIRTMLQFLICVGNFGVVSAQIAIDILHL